jgi:isopenicillin-N epimerase
MQVWTPDGAPFLAGSVQIPILLTGMQLMGCQKALEAAAAEDDKGRGAKAHPQSLTDEEAFWEGIRAKFELPAGFVNLNSGVSPTINDSLSKLAATTLHVSRFPMANLREANADSAQTLKKVAALLGVPTTQLVQMRSTTEAALTIIHGLDLEAGDEILTTDQDYFSLVDGMKAKALRSGAEFKQLKLPIRADKAAILEAFDRAITSETKLLVLSHMIYRTGEILPVREICELAHARGALVLVDGAHSFGHFEFKIADLGCDFYAACLHKWICGPLGSGFLYLKADKIAQIWPLMNHPDPRGTSVRKFYSTFAYCMLAHAGALPALELHEAIGPARRETWLRELKDYWMTRIKDFPKIEILTPYGKERACGIGAFRISGTDAAVIQTELKDKYQLAVGSHGEGADSEIRIAPNVFTRFDELDRLIQAVQEIAARA